MKNQLVVSESADPQAKIRVQIDNVDDAQCLSDVIQSCKPCVRIVNGQVVVDLNTLSVFQTK